VYIRDILFAVPHRMKGRFLSSVREVLYINSLPGQEIKREEVKTERGSNEKCRKEDDKEGKCV
jgi:hypothetical protein